MALVAVVILLQFLCKSVSKNLLIIYLTGLTVSNDDLQALNC